MSRSLAERSGREYPHNAIYEILTYRMNADDINEPVTYNDRTVKAFMDILGNARTNVTLAYINVYQNGGTLMEVGKRLKCSPSTVRKDLNEIYFLQDKDGYVVNKLRRLSE